MLSRTAFLTLSTSMLLGLAACSRTEPGGSENAATPAAEANTGTDAMVAEGGGEANAVAAVLAKTGEMCGGVAGIQCASGKDFCKKPIGQCGTVDSAGKCTTKPQVCTEQYVPVCGCDGKTYGNACQADIAGVSVQSPGKCEGNG